MGVLLPGADLELLERAEAQAFERFWGKSMSELRDISPEEFHQFAGQFRQLVYDLPFQIPEDLVLLGRTVGILSGMCTGLDPDFNLWQGIAPFAQKLIAEEAFASRGQWLDELGALARLLLGMPRRVDGLLGKVERGDLAVHDPQLNSRLDRLERTASRLVGGLVFSALLLGGLQLYLAGREPFAWILLAGAAIALGWVVLGRR
jgi:predicted unusual protein kinase regulating ubiquinone biosynthesis (AarF/ABC1/UbiB family)